MRWLVVVGDEASRARISDLLRPAAASVADDAEWVPLAPDEHVIEVDGPPDLASRLEEVSGIKDVYPSSEMTYY